MRICQVYRASQSEALTFLQPSTEPWPDRQDDPHVVPSQGVGNQQKWDTSVKERSGGNGRALGLPEHAVVAFALG